MQTVRRTGDKLATLSGKLMRGTMSNEKALQNEIALGYDPRFSRGLQGFENLEDAGKSTEDDIDPFLDPKFAPLTAADTSGVRLREFLKNPTANDLVEAAAKSGDPEFRAKVSEELEDTRMAEEGTAFAKAHPEYLPSDANNDRLTRALKMAGLPFTCENLEAAYRVLLAERELEVPKGGVKPLSEGELLSVARLAQSGRVADAIGSYLHYALPDLNARELAKVANDPAYLDLCNDAVYAVFVNSTPDYIDRLDSHEYLERFVNGRPYTLALLAAAWVARKNEVSLQMPALPSEMQPTPENIAASFEDMSAEEVESTLDATLREHARQTVGRR